MTCGLILQNGGSEYSEVPPRHGGGTTVAGNAQAADSADWDGQEVPRPRDIVAWLDQFVVGQHQAKKVRRAIIMRSLYHSQVLSAMDPWISCCRHVLFEKHDVRSFELTTADAGGSGAQPLQARQVRVAAAEEGCRGGHRVPHQQAAAAGRVSHGGGHRGQGSKGRGHRRRRR